MTTDIITKETFNTPGPELDLLVAYWIMDLGIVALDWPCGYHHGCELEASLSRQRLWPQDEPYIVYIDDDYIEDEWPPKLEHGVLMATVEPIPQYSSDIVAAWSVLDQFQDKGIGVGIDTNPGEYEEDGKHVYICEVEDNAFASKSLPLSICVAAVNYRLFRGKPLTNMSVLNEWRYALVDYCYSEEFGMSYEEAIAGNYDFIPASIIESWKVSQDNNKILSGAD